MTGLWIREVNYRSLIREASYVLKIILEGNITTSAALNEIVRTYKTQFQQDAVLRVRGATYVSLVS